MKIWKSKKEILVVLAHPDDPEFFCGATIAKWINGGHKVSYLLLTHGEKGVNDHYKDSTDIISIREQEQIAAGEILGVKEIEFLDFEDGMLSPSNKARKEVVKVIRKKKPDVVVTCDPTNYFLHDRYINHPDHRAAGQIAIDAVFPAAQNRLYYPELISEGYEPHHVEEVWFSLPKDANITFDVTDMWEIKIKALEKHASQIGDPVKFRERMATWSSYTDEENVPRFEEIFNRIVFTRR